MRYYVRAQCDKLMYLFQERLWSEKARRNVTVFWWVFGAENATGYLSEEDAWAAFDRSGTGIREGYAVEAIRG